MIAQSQTIEEIQRQYAGQWVLIDEPEKGADGRTAGGTVVAHGPEPDALCRRATELGLKSIALFYMVGDGDEEVDEVIHL